MKRHVKHLPCLLYMFTNVLNGKRYIGVTTQRLVVRTQQHFAAAKRCANNGAFYRAIRKYGRDAFRVEVIGECKTAADGLKEEMRLIALLKPEYNSTAGGESKAPLSAAGRAKLVARHKGNSYHLGKSHSPETKARLRDLAIENMDIFRQFQALGPKASSRPVLCVDDGRIYESASAAARSYGVCKSAVIELCLGQKFRRTVGGRRFTYRDQVEEIA